ncbi:MAG: glycosyltransferase family 2 protein [bacterium]
MPDVSAPHAGRVVVILPALNEAEAIGGVLTRMPRNELKAQGYALSVWVVDGKSKDGTRDVAMSNGAGVLVQRGNGKGNAMSQAFDFFVDRGENPAWQQLASQRYFIMMDSDGTYPPEAIPSFVNALDEGYDIVMGSRFQGAIEAGALTRLNRLGNRVLTRFAGFLFRSSVTDVCTGMWGLSERFLRRFASTASGFDLEADIFASACNGMNRMTEVAISYSRRVGTAKLVPIRTGLLIAWRLLLRWIRRGEIQPRERVKTTTQVGGAS